MTVKLSHTAAIIQMLATNIDREFCAADIVQELDIVKGSAGTLLSDLAKAGRIERSGRGMYHANRLAAEEVPAEKPKAKKERPRRAAAEAVAVAASLPVAPEPAAIAPGATGLGDKVLATLKAGKQTSVDEIVKATGATRKQVNDSLRGLCKRGKAEKLTPSVYTKAVR